ncbi:hypothetical protein ACPPVT_12705 [Angustibacter sp. McL0619]|uniref:hypothetical protein n=1 Tax=Angustibacter sp. McL0619 TaxID=3415676 RepID=UPI003CEAD923
MSLEIQDPPSFDDEMGSVSLLIDHEAGALVVLHGAIGNELHAEVRELVADLESDVAGTSGRPVQVLAEHVTSFGLPGVWLLLELRRAARPAVVSVVRPSECVRSAIARHSIAGLAIVG